MSLALKPHPFQPKHKSSVVHSLQKYCVFTLIEYRQCLEDVGWIDTESLKDVLRHCDMDLLTTIEDSTREGSDRDLSWYTWDLWYSLYVKEHGRPPSSMQVPELSGTPPPDYFAPRCEGREGDWRLAFQMKTAEKAEKLRMISVKLGAKAKEDQIAKKERTVQQIILAPPPRPRQRRAAPTTGVTKNKGPSNALFGRSKKGVGLVSIGSGWGKPPITSMIKKPAAPGLGTKGVKIVATAASMAKKLGCAAGSSQRSSPSLPSTPTPERPGSSQPSPSQPSSRQPSSSEPGSRQPASAQRPSPGVGRPGPPLPARPKGVGPVAPNSKASNMFINKPQKRGPSGLEGVDLAELVASAARKRQR